MTSTKDKRLWLPKEPVWLEPIGDTHSKHTLHYSVPGFAVVGKVHPSENFPGQWFYVSRAGHSPHSGYEPLEELAKRQIEIFIEQNFNFGSYETNPVRISVEVRG